MKKLEMKLIKTSRKEAGAVLYDVKYDGQIIGRAYRQYYKSAGAWCAGYVGHWKGGYEWILDLDWAPRRFREFKGVDTLCKDFPSLKELKKFLENKGDKNEK